MINFRFRDKNKFCMTNRTADDAPFRQTINISRLGSLFWDGHNSCTVVFGYSARWAVKVTFLIGIIRYGF